jgi:hypothetical protein
LIFFFYLFVYLFIYLFIYLFYFWYGLKVSKEEEEKFLYTTLPNVIELALRVEELMPVPRLCFSMQQIGQ